VSCVLVGEPDAVYWRTTSVRLTRSRGSRRRGNTTRAGHGGCPRDVLVRAHAVSLAGQHQPDVGARQHAISTSSSRPTRGNTPVSLPDLALQGEQLLVSGRERELALVRVEAQPVQNAPQNLRYDPTLQLHLAY